MRKSGFSAVDEIPVCAGSGAETGMQAIGNMGRFHNSYVLGQSGVERRDKTFRFNPRYIGKKMSSLSAGVNPRIGSPRTEKFDGALMQQRQCPLNFALHGTERFLSVPQLFLPPMETRSVV